nr:hypothetical protein [Tanacetum cinerariifolium]
MEYEHLSITPEMKSDEVTKSNAKNFLPIPSECEVTSEDKRKCNELVCENPSTIDDIEYVDASVPDPAIVSVEEENVVQQEEEEVNFEDISQIQDVVLCEKLLSITRLISNIESLNDNSTPDRVFNFFESDNSLLDNFSPEFETFCDNSEETRRKPVNSTTSSRPPNVETDAREEIVVVMIGKDKFDDDSQIFMFDKVFSLLSAESEDTIFDPGLSPGD